MTNNRLSQAAKRLGVPVSQIRSAMFYAEKRLTAKSRADGKWLLRQENRMARLLKGALNEQKAYYLIELAKLEAFNTKGVYRVEQKAILNDLEVIVEEAPKRAFIVDTIITFSGYGLLRGAFRQNQRLDLGSVGIDFTLEHQGAIDYLSDVENTQLFGKKGSIDLVTQNAIKEATVDAITSGKTYNELAAEIQEMGETGVFSARRAVTIATDQLAKAYGAGSNMIINDFVDRTGLRVVKTWEPVGGACPICVANAQDGEIEFEQSFNSGDQHEPAHVNCRCVVAYKVIQ